MLQSFVDEQKVSSLFRVQSLWGKDPRPAGADDEQQHQFWIWVFEDKSEEVAVRQVRSPVTHANKSWVIPSVCGRESILTVYLQAKISDFYSEKQQRNRKFVLLLSVIEKIFDLIYY